ncbi:MAG: RNA methyltransferase [Phycisphaeraceae bacterium]|nr:RNA methyltransferase [Phycisphaeraceae bacterium]
MPRIVPIDSIDDPRVEPYRNQRDAWLRAAHNPARAPDGLDDSGLFIAEGHWVVEQLARSEFAGHSLLIAAPRLDAIGPTLDLFPPDTPAYVAPQPVLDGIAGFHVHRGVLACGHRPPPRDPGDVLDSSRTLVVLVGLTNHDNVGGIFRCVAALAGPDAAVLLTPDTCDPLYRKALRVSMGWALRVPFATIETGAIADLAESGWTTLALTPDPAAPDLADLGPIDRPALLIGAEGPGLCPEILARAARRARIPIDPRVDSLNATVAAGIALSVLARQNSPARPT